MRIRVAIPTPHSSDSNYAAKAYPQYEHAVTLFGGEPVRIPVDLTAAEVNAIAKTCDAVLLPGSKADIDPAKFSQSRSPHTADADKRRDNVDDLLLDDAYANGKPVLGICYGLQSINVYRKGTLVQHIPDFLPEETRSKINHAIGGNVAVAHSVEIQQDSRLAAMVGNGTASGTRASIEPGSAIIVPVNSSHHQSADAVGEGLRIVARCPDDGIVEALEGTSDDHFVLAVQWHPERSVDDDDASRALFRALLEAAR